MESNQALSNAKISLRLLSLDGGWINGLAQLFLLEDIMSAIDPQAPPKPCDVFDLICGTAGGGLIAIMLGRLRMTVDEAIDSYTKLLRSIFEKRTHTSRFNLRGRLNTLYNSEDLRRGLQEIISQRGIEANEPLREPAQNSPITVVTAQRVDNSSLELLSSDPFREHKPSYGMTILEAARVTSALPGSLASVVVGPFQTKYVSGELLANNPINETLLSAKQKWPQATISCLLSIGSRSQPQVSRYETRRIAPYLAHDHPDAKRVADEFLRRNRDMALASSYFRFSLPGLQTYDLDDVSNIQNRVAVSYAYRQEQQTLLTIERCAERLGRSDAPSPREEDEGKDKEVDVPGAAEQQAGTPMERDSETPMTPLKTFESLAEATATCLLDDSEMRSLLSTAIDKIADVRLKRNLAILLEDFAQKLTTDSSLESVAYFVGSRTLDVVDQMLSRLPRGTQYTIETALPSYDEVMCANDEIQDLVETQRKFRTPDPVEAKTALSQFRDAMVQQSLPFTEMKEDLRRFLFPSMKSYIREIILPLLPATNLVPIYSVAVRVHWELENYLDQAFDITNEIDNIMTLTGEVACAQALPCGEYMLQTWPRTGAATLTAVKYTLQLGYSYHQYSPTHSIRLEFEESEGAASEKAATAIGGPLLVSMNGTPMEIVETIEQFAWFASAFRSVGGNSTALSQVDFRVVSKSSESQELMTELILLPLRSYVDTEPSYGSCWLSLITSSALAWGFPIKEREQAVGLEIPFQGMLKACRVRFPVEYQDSIIIRQDPLTIYPIAQHHDGVQWHAVVGGFDAFFEKMKTFPILSMEKNVDSFSHSRTFVGWLTHAHIRLGTARPTDKASGIDVDNKRGRMLGEDVTTNVNVRVPWVDVVSGSIGTKFLFPKTQMQRNEAMQLGYERTMMRSARTPAIYYDCIDGTSWIVPELSLMLHVVYAALLENFPDLEALYRIPYAKQHGNGGEMAIAAIKESESVVLWKVGKDNTEYRFKDLIEFYLDYFDNRKESMRIRLEHNELRADLGLRGWDFVDLRDTTAFYRCRLVPSPPWSGRPRWWDLAKNPNVLVVLGTNLAQVIIPDRSSAEVCSYWAEIPAKCDLLVGSIRCIEEMCRPWEAKLPQICLSDHIVWHQPEHSNPFDDCTGNRCNPVQKLTRRDLGIWRHFHGLRNPERIAHDGAVIFGRPEDVKKHISSRGLPCAPLPKQDGASQDRIYLATKARPDSYPLIVLNWFGHILETFDFRSFILWAIPTLCMAIVIGWF